MKKHRENIGLPAKKDDRISYTFPYTVIVDNNDDDQESDESEAASGNFHTRLVKLINLKNK